MSESEKSILSNNYFAAHAIEIGVVLQRAVRDALLMHKRLGNPIATWKDGEVVIVPPEEIVIPPDVSDSKE
ncbi:MAG: hypothetical protein AABM67_01470 [Acidobacteriota bacterium]